MFVKLGVVPVCVSVQSAPVTLMVPLFVCAPLARVSVRGWLKVIVPWLSSCALIVRDPPAPTLERIVPPTAFVSVPAVTVSTSEYVLTMVVRSMVPLFVKPLAIVRLVLPTEPFPCTVNVAPAWLVNAPAIAPVPL